MSKMSNLSATPSSMSIKQYVVSGKNGNSTVRVSFNPRSTTTTRQSVGGGENPSILINIGTKNLDSKADVSKAVNTAVYQNQAVSASDMVEKSASNIKSYASDAIKAASTDLPNEDVLGLLQ